MIPPPKPGCPSLRELERESLLGPGERAVEIEEHLASCEQCVQRIHEIQENHSFLSGMRLKLEELGNGRGEDSGAGERGTPPDRIGPYRILETIETGGMGTVYLAEQSEPLPRRVAVKVIKLGMDTRRIIARFRAERQALALMNHPHIAKIHDAGATSTGQPFFVMDYIAGEPITDHCDRHRFSIRERLELFIPVCHAVQHAHQKGIIHRDIKPSNVIVAMEAGQAVPKVIDFGVAKSTATQLDGQAMATRAGMLIGTPGYMSPEQAATSDDIDTRTDVYALGVLLYELLTGVLPFDIKKLRRKSFVEIHRAICEVEPPKPSSRVGRLGDDLSDVAQSRRTTPKNLPKRLRGDLDWITLRALEKDREHRYGSTAQLAEDLVRHLRHEPVMARPPRILYRLLKFTRRYRVPLMAAGGLIVAAIAGTALTTAAYLRAEKNARLAASRYSEVLRLGDLRRLEEYQREADALWPAYPQKIPAMERWLLQAKELSGRRQLHEVTLAALRSKALGATLEEKQAEESSTQKPETHPQPGYRFRNDDDAWYHDSLEVLTDALKVMMDPDPTIGLVASMEARLEFANTVRARSLEDHSEAWEQAIASIADEAECPDYLGLHISPQIGLVPLGQDPRSRLWEFWHLQTGAKPQLSPNPGSSSRWQLTNDTGLIFVLIPSGTFWMGAQKEDPTQPNYDPAASENEEPVHRSSLDPFFLSKYEMTQGQWLRSTAENPSQYGPDHQGVERFALRHPVERVSWSDCHRWFARLGLVLPTEAQFEYAARAGTTSVWFTGNQISSLQGAANLADARAHEMSQRSHWKYDESLRDGYFRHAPVGSFRANGFGLHDMLGNVNEWCADLFKPYEQTLEEPTAESSIKPTYRVLRGGSFSRHPDVARSAQRYWGAPQIRYEYYGVRPARLLDP